MTEPWLARIEAGRTAALLDAARSALGEAVEPCLVLHDVAMLRAKLVALIDAFPAGTLHAVAIKANPLRSLLAMLVRAGAGLEAASWGEVAVAVAAGCPVERIVYDSLAKTEAELVGALELGALINADNFEELARIDRLRYGSTAPVGLRVNPLVAGGSIAMTDVSRRGSKFGVAIGRSHEIADAFGRYPWLDGLHLHTGSQGYGVERLAEAVRRVDGLRRELEAHVGAVPRVDIGGGLPASYRTGERVPTAAEYVARLRQVAPGLFADGTKLVTEFGRALQAGCGIALSRVEYVKQQTGRRTAILHFGADLLVRPVYQSADWPHEFAVLDSSGRPKEGPLEPVQLAGPLCFAGDVLATSIELPHIEAGDWLVVRDAGAYTLAMWSRYCSRALPLVVGVDGEAVEVLRARETADDLVRFWSEPGA